MGSDGVARASYEVAAAALEVAPFEVRLRRWLDAVRVLCRAEGAALLEIDARDGRLAQRVRVASGLDPGEALPIPDTTFRHWLAQVGVAHDLGALGGDFVGHQGLVIPVEVRPRWDGRTDAALCLTSGVHPPRELLLGLERALSADRDTRTARLLRIALDQCADTVELTDVDVRVVHVNTAFEALFGYTREELVGSDLLRLRDADAPRHDPQFYRFAQENVNQHGSWRSTLGSRHRDGHAVTAEISVNLVDAPDLRFRGNLAMRRDLQHRAARDRALSMAHLEIRGVFGKLPYAIVVIREGKFYFGNAPFFKILGRTADEVLSTPLSQFVHPDDLAGLDQTLQEGATGLRILRADGAVRIVDVRSAGEISFEGYATRILLVDDTTDRRLDQARDEHANRLAALGGLAASVAHEINNPLAALTSNLEWLIEVGALPEHQRVLGESLEVAQRIRQIIADLKAFSRDETRVKREDVVDVGRALAAALNLTANELRHFAGVETRCPAKVLARCKEGSLVQALVNLVMNASQAMRTVADREHRLRIVVETTGDEVEIAVTDTGPGISAAVLPNLFAPFVSSRTEVGGTGLGLWISRRIIESFGGTLTAESDGRTGSTFRIRLQSARPSAAPAPVPPAPRQAAGARVVVIDDDAPVAKALARLLTGNRVETFEDSREALDRLIAGELPDAVFCDLMMPGLNGDVVYEKACAVRPELRERFIFVTGGSFSDGASSFLAQCTTPVLFKPFNATELREALGARLASRVTAKA